MKRPGAATRAWQIISPPCGHPGSAGHDDLGEMPAALVTEMLGGRLLAG